MQNPQQNKGQGSGSASKKHQQNNNNNNAVFQDQNSVGFKNIKDTNTPMNQKTDNAKEGLYMKKMQLLNPDNFADENNTPNGGLRVDTFGKLKLQLTQIPSPKDDRWEELIISGRNIQNRSVCASVIFDDSLYVYGGYEINAGILSDFYKLNLTRNTYVWESVVQKNKSPGKLCRQHSIVHKGKMYMLGGQYIGSLNTNKMYCFDFTTSLWSEIEYKNKNQIEFPNIDSHKAIMYKDSMIVMSGYLGDLGKYNDLVYSFDMNSQCWSVLYDGSKMHHHQHDGGFRPRIGTDLALVNDRIYLFGGYDGQERLNDLFYFDLKTNKFQEVFGSTDQIEGEKTIPKKRKGHSLSLFQGSIFLFGGIHDVTWELDDLFAYDVAENQWRLIEDDSARRKDYSSVTDISPTKDQINSKKNSIKRNFQHSQTFMANTNGQFFNNLPQLIKQKTCCPPSPAKSNGSSSSPRGSATRKNALSKTMVQNDPYYILEEQEENGNSPTRNLESQKKKQFFQRKADMLAMLQTDAAEETELRNKSNSPTSEAMKNALLTVGNPMPELKVRKGRTSDFGKTTYSKFLEPIKSPTSSRVGKKPCARDGHSALVFQEKLYIFGGDRHKMSFNDVFALNLEKCLPTASAKGKNSPESSNML